MNTEQFNKSVQIYNRLMAKSKLCHLTRQEQAQLDDALNNMTTEIFGKDMVVPF